MLKLGQIKIRTKWLSKAVLKRKRVQKERKTHSLTGVWGNGGSYLLSTMDGSLDSLPINHWKKDWKWSQEATAPICHSCNNYCTKVYQLPRVKETRHDSINSNSINQIGAKVIAVFTILFNLLNRNHFFY